MFGGNIRDSSILVYPSVQEGHDIEWRANNTAVLAEAVGRWYRHIGVLESVDYPVFPFHLVSCGRQQLSRRLLSHNIFGTRRVRQLIGGIRLSIPELWSFLLAATSCSRGSKTYLLHVNWNLDLGDSLLDVALKRGDIYRLAYCASHGCSVLAAYQRDEGLL